jgi:hypothetical protein
MLLLDIFSFVMASALGSWLLSLVVSGMRTGRIRHSSATSTYSFRHEPVKFCFTALVFLLFSSAFLYVAGLRALVIWNHVCA